MSGAGHQAALAIELGRQGALEPAVAACVEALALDDGDARLHALLGELLLRVDAYEASIASATKAIEIDPTFAAAYLVLGLAYERRGGMWDQAVLVWHELAEVAPDLATAHVQLGEAFLAAGFIDEAIEAWEQALEVDPGKSRALYDLAIVALQREGAETALPGFRAAGELDPSQDAYFFRALDEAARAGHASPGSVSTGAAVRRAEAVDAARGGDLFGAADLVRERLHAEPADAEMLALGAYLYLKQKATVEAMALGLRSLAVSSTSPGALYVLGVAFALRPGMNTQAARVFTALSSVDRRDPMPRVLLGEALLGEGRFGDALDAYKIAAELDPRCVRARFGLAAGMLADGRHAEAMWEIHQAATYDTQREGLFWTLWDREVSVDE